MRLFSRTPSIEPREAADLLASRSAVVVDVRQQDEWRSGHVEGAIHVPLGELSSRLGRLPGDTTIVTVCRSGHRSAVAAKALARAGHDVLNLRGGMNAWVRAGLPLASGARKQV